MPQPRRPDDLRSPLIISTCLHVGLMAFMYFGLPSFFNPPPAPPWRPIPVDIVEIGAITNTRIKQEEEEQAAKTAPPTKPAPAPEVKPPEPPKPPEPTPKPAEPPKEPAPDEVALPEKKPKPKPPEPKPIPKPVPQVDPLASVLKNVAKLKPEPAPVANAKPDEKKMDGTEETPKISQQGPALSDRLTISEEDALRRQISSCWNMPIGAKDAQDLIVEVLIEVNEDRTVARAEIVDQSRFATDTHFRAAAEAALRALRHPRCTPLELPPDQYEQWKVIRFNFDPRDML